MSSSRTKCHQAALHGIKAMSLKWKFKNKQVRLIFGDGEYLSRTDVVKVNPNKVFAIIGPFDNHTDKSDLQDMLETICRGYNLKPL